MSQLLIIDVQSNYAVFVYDNNLLEKIRSVIENYSSVVYLWDNTSGEEFNDEFPMEWDNEYSLDEDGYEVETPGVIKYINHFIEKQYGFFRQFMSYGIDDEDIIKLGKFMLNNNLWDFRQINQEDEKKELFLKEFDNHDDLKNLLEDDGYSFWLPDDLIGSLREKVTTGVTLVGGGRQECLYEVAMLLDILDIKYIIDESLTY